MPSVDAAEFHGESSTRRTHEERLFSGTYPTPPRFPAPLSTLSPRRTHPTPPAKVYTITRLIPPGRVTSYGHIARLAGSPNHSRMVGAALKLLGPSSTSTLIANGFAQTGIDDVELPDQGPEEEEQAEGGGTGVPWHRVINSSGGISPRGDGGAGAARQVALLRAEGVEVSEGVGGGVEVGHAGGGAYRVSLARFGWFPESVDAELEGLDEEEG